LSVFECKFSIVLYCIVVCNEPMYCGQTVGRKKIFYTNN